MSVTVISKELSDKLEKLHKVSYLKIRPRVVSDLCVSLSITAVIKGVGEFCVADNMVVSTDGILTIKTSRDFKIKSRLEIQ